MHKYHVVLADDTERDITAADVKITANGALVFEGDSGDSLVVYAPGQWVAVEVERKDDK